MKSQHLSYVCAALMAVSVGACSETVPAPPVNAPAAAEASTTTAKGSASSPAMTGSTAAQASQTTSKATAPKTPAAKVPEVPFEGRRIALVHTANVVGELEPCG